MKVLEGRKVPIKLWTDSPLGTLPVESAAMEQLQNVASLPFVFHHLAVMPDVHVGKGGTVGSVIPTLGAIIPATVGVDIGCGMSAVLTDRTSQSLPENLGALRSAIEAAVPVGNGAGGSFAEVPAAVTRAAGALWSKYVEVVESHGIKGDKLSQQLGTLGGGNHFIEVCLDEADRVWLLLHSGSRGIGNKIGTYFINLAKEDMRQHFINLPDKDLAYFPEGTEHFEAYMKAIEWAQAYALANRKLMMEALVGATGFRPLEEVVSCHHNYVSREHHFGKNVLLTRKGAVDASQGRLGIIPGSMGQQSFIVRGLGSRESFHSCSHGAGRAMSRTAARKAFTVADLVAQTEGVECRKDEGVLDELPSAYKPLDLVMAAQEDLVEKVHSLKAILTVKG